MTDEQIKAAWERYHGPDLPEVSAAYLRGYRDGHEAAREEIRGPDTLEKRFVLCPGCVADEAGKQVDGVRYCVPCGNIINTI
jgi:hypothetical protein